MSSEKTDSTRTIPSHSKHWLNPKRKRFWAVLLILLYTLAGFFLVPLLVKNQLIGMIRDDLGREASIEQVQFNPYHLSLRINDFTLKDTDGVKLSGFDEFFVNFQLSSLFHWAWTFREFRLDGSFFHLERFAPGDSRLGRLLDDVAANRPPTPEKKETGGLPRLLIHELSLGDGSAQFIDRVPETPVELAIGPVSVSIQQLNTLPDRYGQQSVQIRLPGDASLGWQGSISLSPLESEGKLTIENSHLDQAIAYLKGMLPLESMAATLSISTDYRIAELPDGSFDFELDALEAGLEDLAISGLTPVTEIVTLGSLAVQGGKLRYPENEINFSSVRITDPGLTAWLDENGRFSLLDLIPQSKESASDSETPVADPASWKLGIDEFTLDGGELDLTDQTVSPPAALDLSELQISVSRISNTPGQSMPFSLAGALSGGNFGIEGEAVVLPDFSVTGKSSFGDIPLNLAQPYVQQQVSLLIEGGTVSSQAEFSVSRDQAIKVNGSLTVSGMKAKDTVENEDLLAWERLNIDQFELDVISRSAQLSRVEFLQPYGRLEINQDRSTNLKGLLIKPAQAKSEPDTEAVSWSLIIGGIAVNNGVMDFSDLSLPLPFGTRISDLDGTVSTIDTASSEPANIRMEGQVDEYGLARIEGGMRVFDPVGHTDVSLEFRNLLMSRLSPYSAQFAGREIDEGKLDLDLRYFIEQGKLQGQNNIVLSDLMLGAEVDSPDAVSLPLGLAVALLKDANGVIDIDLPVEGDINDPEFRIGGVVMKAIVGLITKVVTAPFRMLGALIGVDSEDFGQFQFLAGRSDLTPPELEKVVQLQRALQERPELGIELSGVFDPATDGPKLQFFRLRDLVLERMDEEQAAEDKEIEMLDEGVRSVLEAIFTERFPAETTETLKTANSAPPANDPEGKPMLDELAYAADLRDRLLASEDISPTDFEALANARAEAIRAAFLTSGEFEEQRIVIAAPSEVESEDSEWVLMELGVAAD